LLVSFTSVVGFSDGTGKEQNVCAFEGKPWTHFGATGYRGDGMGEFILFVVQFITARLNHLTTTKTAHAGEGVLFSLVLCASLDCYSHRVVAQSLCFATPTAMFSGGIWKVGHGAQVQLDPG
jgi:hypothetical protein